MVDCRIARISAFRSKWLSTRYLAAAASSSSLLAGLVSRMSSTISDQAHAEEIGPHAVGDRAG